ncbi:MAG TPA: SpoVG family protein [Pirellulales bacterium]|nr:SpoVG family protein [Pirellulales bacterium]
MEVTEVRIKLIEEAGERLQAFCSITFDNCFVIRDLKIIGGANGPFVAMPSRKLTAHCPQCGCKNHLRAAYCNQCGTRLKEDRTIKDEEGRLKLYADIAHPINSACREMIQDRVIREFREEIVRSKQPGYVSRYEDFDGDDFVAAASASGRGRRELAAGERGAARETPAYTRSGSEPASRVQPAEPQQPPPPHSIPIMAASAATATVVAATTTASTTSEAVSAGLVGRSPPPADGFGAGIF